MTDKEKPLALVVEDDPRDLELILRAFAEAGVDGEITTAKDGAEAQVVLFGEAEVPNSRPEKLPDVIFLDLKLPRVDGLAVLKRIRQDERTRLIPVVMLSSSKLENDVTKSYTLGANSYVVKPVKFEEFVKVVGNMGYYWIHLSRAGREDESRSWEDV